MTLDVIIHGGYVLTMEGPGSGMIPNGAVAIRGDSIVAVATARTDKAADEADKHAAHHRLHRTLLCADPLHGFLGGDRKSVV